MPNLLRTLWGERTETRYSLDAYAADLAQWWGRGYAPGAVNESYDRNTAQAFGTGFEDLVQGAYQRNGPLFAVQLARLVVFTEARFQWQEIRGGRPGKLWGNAALGVLEAPWLNGTTGELLARMIQDADIGGTAIVRRTLPTAAADRLERLRPDWTTIVLGSNPDLITPEIVGYVYMPGGPASTEDPIYLARQEVAQWAPIPDPMARYRGMSWMRPIVRELRGDSSATDHKLAFFEHAATPNLVIRMDPTVTEDAFKKFQAIVETNHRGALNAWKNLYLGGAVDVDVVGSSFKDMDLRNVQGALETRIAAAGGVPPVIVGLSEGLAAATYSNYGQARRSFADRTLRPLWRSACAALQQIITPPGGSRLWYDDRDIPFLQEDRKDAAEIAAKQAETMAALVREGWDPDSVRDAVMAEDWSLLKHSGLTSVQLQADQAAASSGSTDNADQADTGGDNGDTGGDAAAA